MRLYARIGGTVPHLCPRHCQLGGRGLPCRIQRHATRPFLPHTASAIHVRPVGRFSSSDPRTSVASAPPAVRPCRSRALRARSLELRACASGAMLCWNMFASEALPRHGHRRLRALAGHQLSAARDQHSGTVAHQRCITLARPAGLALAGRDAGRRPRACRGAAVMESDETDRPSIRIPHYCTTPAAAVQPCTPVLVFGIMDGNATLVRPKRYDMPARVLAVTALSAAAYRAAYVRPRTGEGQRPLHMTHAVLRLLGRAGGDSLADR